MLHSPEFLMTTPVALRVRKSRAALRAAGLRPLQIWVPDTRHPNFVREARRQSLLLARADRADPSWRQITQQAAAETTGWTE
jgi:hypothetical protein